MAARLPDATLKFYDGGHLFMVQDPDVYTDLAGFSVPPRRRRIMTQTNPETIATGAARLRAEISGHLACVTISYPERHNIIDLEGWLAFPDLMARLATIRMCA